MQYLLTEEERRELVPVADLRGRDSALVAAVDMILKLAKHTCIHARPQSTEYCDNCPCSSTGSNRFKLTYEQSRLICRLPRNYSQ